MSDADPFADARDRLLKKIASDAAETETWTGRKAFAPTVMQALARVPRHAFVPKAEQSVAYENRPLSIGFNQTISQPFIVAVMTDLLDLKSTDRVLEIGTGCGYQTAVLAELAAHVCSIERIAELARGAERRLAALGYANTRLRVGDGFLGWPEEAPFDAILVTAAPAQIPPALIQQLAPHGRLVIPVGERNDTQMLLRCTRTPVGLARENKLPVAFVPMLPGL